MCVLSQRIRLQLDDARAGALPQRYLRDGRRHHLHEMRPGLCVCEHGILNGSGLCGGLL